MAYNTYLTRRLIQQGQSARLNGPRCPLPVPFRMPHPLPLCRGQIWVIRRIDEHAHIQVFNETIRLPPRYAHEFVRVVIRTGPQTLSVYWTASQQGRLKRIVHRAYRLREKASTPLL